MTAFNGIIIINVSKSQRNKQEFQFMWIDQNKNVLGHLKNILSWGFEDSNKFKV